MKTDLDSIPEVTVKATYKSRLRIKQDDVRTYIFEIEACFSGNIAPPVIHIISPLKSNHPENSSCYIEPNTYKALVEHIMDFDRQGVVEHFIKNLRNPLGD